MINWDGAHNALRQGEYFARHSSLGAVDYQRESPYTRVIIEVFFLIITHEMMLGCSHLTHLSST